MGKIAGLQFAPQDFTPQHTQRISSNFKTLVSFLSIDHAKFALGLRIQLKKISSQVLFFSLQGFVF